jgi:hypothetical protein
MSALATDRNTLQKDGKLRSIPVAASKLIYAGAIVMVNSSGLAVPGVTATGLTPAGVADARADNSAGIASAINVKVKRGVFCFDNSASADAIAEKDIGATVYVVDDHTVALTSASSTRSVAGSVYEVDADGVWVEFK